MSCTLLKEVDRGTSLHFRGPGPMDGNLPGMGMLVGRPTDIEWVPLAYLSVGFDRSLVMRSAKLTKVTLRT